jgi:hypothetical protein
MLPPEEFGVSLESQEGATLGYQQNIKENYSLLSERKRWKLNILKYNYQNLFLTKKYTSREIILPKPIFRGKYPI